MDPENSVLVFLSRFRYLILVLLVAASLTNAIVRFLGDWGHFWEALALQAWFGQAVFSYLRGGWVAIGPGGLSKNANPIGRAALAATAFAIYVLLFTYDGYKRDDSIYERRASDWTMPTREEIGRSTDQK
ncbi:hypothetical protein IB252_09495 [Pseudomonas sp. PDM10]|uniref:hypothetical protein n=1 Tax=Pseudomonas sp. PDM10 TaxID=2769269 RepID=UPI00178740CC|nr:hypothetical protein [Pseudomonas sp. PDM10]MBD9600037.1 hypothetical protein [Pseudomonas sp. PDM10]